MAGRMTSSTTPPAPRPRLRRNLLLLYGGEGVAKALGLLTFAHLGRHLPKAAYGDLEFAIAAFFVLYLVLEAGLDPYGAREGAKRPAETARLAGRIAVLRAGLLGVSLLLLGGLGLLAERGSLGRALLWLYGLVLLPMPLVLNWVFQARDRMGVVAASTCLRQLVLFLGVVLFVRAAPDARWVPVSDALALTLVMLLHQGLYRAGGGRIALPPERAELARTARECAPLALSTLAWAARVYAPTLVLWFAASATETARYGASHRLVFALHTFVWLYFVNLLPSLSRATLEPDRATYRRLVQRSLRRVAWLVLPGCLALAALAPWVVPAVYGPEFRGDAGILQVMLGMPAVAFLSGHHRYALIAHGHVGPEFRASLAGGLVAVLGALALAAAGRLDASSAAALFVAAELTTLLAAQAALARRVEALSLASQLWRPALAMAAGWAAYALFFPGSPWLGASAIAAATLASMLLLAPDVLAELAGRRPAG